MLLPAAPAPAAASARPSDRVLAAQARDLIRDTHPAATGLLPLATHLDVSPYRLSRVFTREVGVSLTRYRNRLRVTRALDRLAAGETHLGRQDPQPQHRQRAEQRPDRQGKHARRKLREALVDEGYLDDGEAS